MIRDLAKNPIASGTEGELVGFVDVEDVEEILKLKIYNFFLESIRREDQKESLFLKRFLEGAQQIWEDVQKNILSIKTLWDIANVEDRFLIYLKNQVGWTKELDHITDGMDDDTLRKLISVSVALWKYRGTEDALRDALSIITGERLFLYTWQDFRNNIGINYLNEEWSGEDSWISEISDEGGADDYYMLLEISDNGRVNRDVVVGITDLMRPLNETIQINYMLFYDLFSVDLDNTQWIHLTDGDVNVLNGEMSLDDDASEEVVYTNEGNTNLWDDYSYSALIRRKEGAGGYGIFFRYTDEDNTYKFTVTPEGNEVVLSEITSGVETVLSTVYVEGFPFNTDVVFNIRASVIGDNIRVLIDNNEIANVTDSSHSTGNIGVFHDAGCKIAVSEVKNRPIPVECDIVT